MNIAEILAQPESKLLEYKSNLSSPDRAIRSIVAFANTAGGLLIIGVEDGTRQVLGVADPIAVELQAANLIADNVKPHLIPDIQVVSHDGKSLVVIEVHRSANAPHYMKRDGVTKGVYIRIGSTNRVADAPLIAELRRSLHHEAYDETALPELHEEDIVKEACTEDFRELRPLKKADFVTMGLLAKHNRRLVPTVGGVLLYGRDRLDRFADAWLQVGAFAGSDRAEVLDAAEIKSFLPRAPVEVLTFLRRNMSRSSGFGEARRVDQYEIPLAVVREALINAIVHADYSQRGSPIRVALYRDRLEIQSPGLLPFGMTIEDMQHGLSKIRNRVIGRVFKELQLIEQWGSGVQRMNTLMRSAGLPPPILEEIGTTFRVTLSKERILPVAVSETQAAILDLLRTNRSLPTHVIAQRLGRSTRTVRQHLRTLVELGLVREQGTSRQDPNKVYVVV